jgi:hypothetical protein
MKKTIVQSPIAISIFKDFSSFNCFTSIYASTNIIKNFDFGIYCEFNISRHKNNYSVNLNTFHTVIVNYNNKKIMDKLSSSNIKKLKINVNLLALLNQYY